MQIVNEGTLVAVYEMLIRLPPFNRWRLPPSAEVDFKARKLHDCLGMYEPDPHTITLSTAKVGHLDTVIKTMAHEIVHLYLYSRKSPSWDKHDEVFSRLTARIAEALGFDPKEL